MLHWHKYCHQFSSKYTNVVSSFAILKNSGRYCRTSCICFYPLTHQYESESSPLYLPSKIKEISLIISVLFLLCMAFSFKERSCSLLFFIMVLGSGWYIVFMMTSNIFSVNLSATSSVSNLAILTSLSTYFVMHNTKFPANFYLLRIWC